MFDLICTCSADRFASKQKTGSFVHVRCDLQFDCWAQFQRYFYSHDQHQYKIMNEINDLMNASQYQWKLILIKYEMIDDLETILP